MPTTAVTISTLKDIWERTLKKFQSKINDDNIFNAFFADSYIYKYEGNKVTVAVSSAFAKSIITKSYLNLLSDTLSEVSETNLIIELILADEIKETNPIVKEEKKNSLNLEDDIHECECVSKCIKNLKEIDILILNYFYYHSKTTKEIAIMLNVSEINVRCRLFRLRNKIRKEISDKGGV